MVTYQREYLFDIIGEVEPLLREHYEELTLNKERIVLDPVWPEYALLEKMGRFVVFTAREDGKLVGYNAFFTVKHIHYGALNMAINDVLYLHKAHRRGLTGIRLLKFAEAQLRDLIGGPLKVTYHIKFSLDWSAILHRMGYADEEKVVGKLL
jgi:GNAT superfamily N-acetyltransferase